MHKDSWTDRQYMLDKHSFEYHHYVDEVPPVVNNHQHPFYEIFFFLSGNAKYTIEGRTYSLRPGDILLTNSHDFHRPEVAEGEIYERIVIWLGDDFFERLPDGGGELYSCFTDAAFRDYRLIRPNDTQLSRLKNLCDRISSAKEDGRFGNTMLEYTYLLEFLVLVGRCYYESKLPEGDVYENNDINRVIEYINAHIREEITLDRLASEFFISKFYLSKQFRIYTGVSIYQYVMKKRLTLARDSLFDGESVGNAFSKCGFGDYSNFHKAFRREFGCAPKDYRKKISENSEA